jgi:DNA-binding FadR family transcriptional regulator
VTPIDHLIEQDRTILSAVEARDPDWAERILREHLAMGVETVAALTQTNPDFILDDIG